MNFRIDTHIKSTRKSGPCVWCGQRIDKGAKAYKSAGCHNGDFFSIRFHPECYGAEEEWWKDNLHEEAPDPGSMHRGSTEIKVWA